MSPNDQVKAEIDGYAEQARFEALRAQLLRGAKRMHMRLGETVSFEEEHDHAPARFQALPGSPEIDPILSATLDTDGSDPDSRLVLKLAFRPLGDETTTVAQIDVNGKGRDILVQDEESLEMRPARSFEDIADLPFMLNGTKRALKQKRIEDKRRMPEIAKERLAEERQRQSS